MHKWVGVVGFSSPLRTHRAAHEPLLRRVSLPQSLSQLVLSPAPPSALAESMKCAFFSLFTASGLLRDCAFALPPRSSHGERGPAMPPGTLVTPRLARLSPSQPTSEARNHTTTTSRHTHPPELVPAPHARRTVTNSVSQMRNFTATEAERCQLPDFSSC